MTNLAPDQHTADVIDLPVNCPIAGTGLLHKVDFNLLVPLQALLVEANVTRAAERANVGQPAMSASLAKLRRHFRSEERRVGKEC